MTKDSVERDDARYVQWSQLTCVTRSGVCQVSVERLKEAGILLASCILILYSSLQSLPQCKPTGTQAAVAGHI